MKKKHHNGLYVYHFDKKLIFKTTEGYAQRAKFKRSYK